MARVKYTAPEPRELILPVFTQWEKVGSVTTILATLEQGEFYSASLLVEQMMRDDRVRALLNTLIMSVLGSPSRWEPADHTARAERLAEEIDEGWHEQVPEEELYELVRWALMLGVGVMHAPWDGKTGMTSAKTWHPGALWFNLNEDTYYLRYQGGQLPMPPESIDWLLLTPYSHKYARLNGLVRSMSMLYLARQWVFRDRARHSEIHGLPIRVGITPMDADKKAKSDYRHALSAIGTETVIITPQGADGRKYGVELVEAKSNSHEVFASQLDHLDDCMAILVLGQRMSSKGSAGLGSDKNPGDAVRRDIMAWLARVIGRLCTRLARSWTLVNYGRDAVAKSPQYIIDVDPPDDGKATAEEYSTLGDAVAKLQAHGLDIRQLLEEAGVPLLSPEEAAAQRAEQEAQAEAEAAQDQANAMGTGASDEDDTGEPDTEPDPDGR